MRPEAIHAAFTRHALRTPNAPAVIDGATRLTYAELDRASGGHAAALAARGAGPGRVVPVVLPRGARLIAVLLGVLKTGAAYAALDRRWPSPRREAIIASLDAPVVVGEDWDAAPAGFTGPEVDPSRPASVFFTSGSTGEPKGVVSPHRGTTRLTIGDYADFATGMLQAAPVAWDAYSIETWGPLTSGGTVIVAATDYLMPGDLRAAIAAGADTAFLTTALFNLFTGADPGCFTGLRQLMTGGETASAAVFRAFLDAHPGIALIHCYGPVEATGYTTAHRVTPADVGEDVPIGRPVPETGVLLLDGDRPVAPGETGEICVTGTGLAIGYLGRPDLTVAAFGVHAGERMYRTGDRGRFDADGVLHFAGRADRQVKVAGHRVEPGEVEAAARALDGVRDAAVVPVPGDGGYAHLALFYLGEADPRALRRALGERLPRYLVPARVHRMTAFPRTPNGKLDREALLGGAA
ncbi:hypothetical protein Afil01_05490 [Actinorhabdospora filicis]|uniref:Amino acid adenylation domain-containing protein n=1 Tax=Actinorhabdospora filicis TaxID=1785913 RepID=A0A9W6W1C4_9ACTN|nr:AMP-binding protein [Actinorhabdospora filicis]GLZ75742.1 hypothetical protein Afil01_05490 [Actinorhabdospora filicis]